MITNSSFLLLMKCIFLKNACYFQLKYNNVIQNGYAKVFRRQDQYKFFRRRKFFLSEEENAQQNDIRYYDIYSYRSSYRIGGRNTLDGSEVIRPKPASCHGSSSWIPIDWRVNFSLYLVFKELNCFDYIKKNRFEWKYTVQIQDMPNKLHENDLVRKYLLYIE